VIRFRIVLAASSLLALTGCADGGRTAAAGAVASRMLAAVAAADGTTACALLAPRTAATFENACPRAILEQKLPPPGRVRSAQVFGQWAQVRLDGDTVFLAVFPGGWRVVAAGCTPQGSRPYDCTVEGD
jgi:hypothetical protein